MFNLSTLNNEFTVSDFKTNYATDEEDMDSFFDDVYHLFSIGLVHEALAKLDTIKEDNPEYGRALFYKSVISSVLGDKEEANDLFRKSMISEVSKARGIDIDVLENCEFDDLLDEMDDIAGSADAFNQGFDHYISGDFEKALKLFDHAIELNPSDAEAIYYKALTLARLQDFEIAIEVIN